MGTLVKECIHTWSSLDFISDNPDHWKQKVQSLHCQALMQLLRVNSIEDKKEESKQSFPFIGNSTFLLDVKSSKVLAEVKG